MHYYIYNCNTLLFKQIINNFTKIPTFTLKKFSNRITSIHLCTSTNTKFSVCKVKERNNLATKKNRNILSKTYIFYRCCCYTPKGWCCKASSNNTLELGKRFPLSVSFFSVCFRLRSTHSPPFAWMAWKWAFSSYWVFRLLALLWLVYIKSVKCVTLEWF